MWEFQIEGVGWEVDAETNLCAACNTNGAAAAGAAVALFLGELCLIPVNILFPCQSVALTSCRVVGRRQYLYTCQPGPFSSCTHTCV